MKRLAPLAAAVACLLIAACGGSAPRHCTPGDYATGCALRHLPAPVQQFGATPAKQGVDFAWTKVAPAQAGAFGASYLSTDASKDWTAALVAAYHKAGKGTVAVYETSATRALAGCSAGAADARFSEGLLNGMGYRHAHFDMAVDFDATPAQIAGPVYQYFRCANQAEPGLVGAYGDYYVIRYLAAQHVVTKSWQAYAWSGGLWRPASEAPLEQYLNGSAFDHDRALAVDYGQFPSPARPARVLPLCYHRRESVKACAAARARVAADWRAVHSSRRALHAVEADLAAHRCVKPYRRGVCRRDGHSAGVFRHRARWFLAALNRIKAAN